MPSWVHAHSRGFVQLCHVDEFNNRHKDVSDWVHASDEWTLWNREHVRDDRADVLWSTVHREELYSDGTGDTWYNTCNGNGVRSEYDLCISGG